MKEIFSGSEVIELGIQIEKNGYDFYTGLSRKINNPVFTSVFDLLAQEEEKHIGVFRKLLEKISLVGSEVSLSDEYSAYISSLAGKYVFTQAGKGFQIAKKITSALEAVDLGIGFERDSIIFYEGIKVIVPENEKNIVSELILQEEKHLKRLLDFKAKLSGGK